MTILEQRWTREINVNKVSFHLPLTTIKRSPLSLKHTIPTD